MNNFKQILNEVNTSTVGDLAKEVLHMVERDMEEVDSISEKMLRKIASSLSKLTKNTNKLSSKIEGDIMLLINDIMDIDWLEEPDDYPAVITIYPKINKLLKNY